MIVRSTRERYAGGFRIVRYDVDEAGRCTPRVTESDFDEDIDSYYQQQDQRLGTLEAKVLAGEVSPIALYLEMSRMTEEEAAARLRLRRTAVRAHTTPRGFERARVETLAKYARLFDVSVADFFQFTHLDGPLSVEVEHGPGRVVQKVAVASAARGTEE